MKSTKTLMRRIFFQNFSTSKRFSKIPLQNFFSKDFLLHKDNIKEVVNQFESLSIKDRLKILSFFLYQIKVGSHIYKNSRSVQWILREMNTDQMIRLSSDHFWRFSLQNILDAFDVMGSFPNQEYCKKLILKFRELIPFVKDKSQLDFIFGIVETIKKQKSCLWKSTYKILDYEEVTGLEKSTKSFRSVNQSVKIFILLKEFDLSEIFPTEFELASTIIKNIENVDSFLFVEFTVSLLSTFAFDFSSKNRKIDAHLRHTNNTSCFDDSQAYQILCALNDTKYEIKEDSPKKNLKKLAYNIKLLASYSDLLFQKLFPVLVKRIWKINVFSIQQNFLDPNVIQLLYTTPRIYQSLNQKDLLDFVSVVLDAFFFHLRNNPLFKNHTNAIKDLKSINTLTEIDDFIKSETNKIYNNNIFCGDNEHLRTFCKLLRFCVTYTIPIFVVFSFYRSEKNSKDVLDEYRNQMLKLILTCLESTKTITILLLGIKKDISKKNSVDKSLAKVNKNQIKKNSTSKVFSSIEDGLFLLNELVE